MGRGRKGIVTQSHKKLKPDRSFKTKREERIGISNKQFFVRGEINLQEDTLEVLKHMNPQQLVNFLLPNDDWLVKNSNRQRFWKLIKVTHKKFGINNASFWLTP